MFTSFTEGAGERLTERATLALCVPATIFWAGGVATLLVHDQAGFWGWGLANLAAGDVTSLRNQIPNLFSLSASDFQQFTLVTGIVVAIGIVFFSALAVDHFVRPALQWTEGYLPTWLDFVRRALMKRQRFRVERECRKRDRLAEVERERRSLADHEKLDVLSYAERTEYRDLDRLLEVRTPRDKHALMPTELGNILRAAETRPRNKYGLDVIVCWPRLWLVLPESATKELAAARADLDTAIRIGLWGGLFLVWSIWVWWAVPVAILVIFLAYRSALEAAVTYGKLMESAFDMYRVTLFEKAGWSPPRKQQADEIADGEALTAYFWYRPSSTLPVTENPPASQKTIETPNTV